jgi:GNAT superfamily N-acetyltransferase
MFESIGSDPAQLAASDEAVAAYFSQAIPAGQFYGWLAFTDAGVAVVSGGVVLDQHPPGPNNLSGQTGYIMNLSTAPGYRRQGIARRIMQAMLDWLTEQGIQLAALHATDVGRSVPGTRFQTNQRNAPSWTSKNTFYALRFTRLYQ